MGAVKREILRVRATRRQIRQSYGALSRLYTVFEGALETGLRKRALELLCVQEGETVLEIGFGTGYSLAEIAKSVGEGGRACGVDLTRQMVEMASKRLRKEGLADRAQLCQADAKDLPFGDSTFDRVYMAAVLELFDTPEIPHVLSEVRRVLKPGGKLAVASMSKEGHERSLFLRFYEWLHSRIPKYASCRPIYVEEAIKGAGFAVRAGEEFTVLRLFPMRIVMASL